MPFDTILNEYIVNLTVLYVRIIYINDITVMFNE